MPCRAVVVLFKVCILQHGHVIISGTAAQLSADPTVQKAYLGAA
ncbi:MAG: hypothetical protein H5U29_06535 [Pusillimonas sp.]|nr:hypothetical protein [Pusillimonas sp.]